MEKKDFTGVNLPNLLLQNGVHFSWSVGVQNGKEDMESCSINSWISRGAQSRHNWITTNFAPTANQYRRGFGGCVAMGYLECKKQMVV